MPRKLNLLADLCVGPEELFQTLAENPDSGVRIERIVSCGHASAEDFWYDQAQAEWVMLLQGNAVLAIEGQADVELQAFDSLLIAAGQRHRVKCTSSEPPAVWLAVYL